jgi:hypothetical protein
MTSEEIEHPCRTLRTENDGFPKHLETGFVGRQLPMQGAVIFHFVLVMPDASLRSFIASDSFKDPPETPRVH